MNHEESFNKIKSLLTLDLLHHAKAVYGKYEMGLCPYLNFIRVDALESKDWFNGISQNSVYVTFEIDTLHNKVKILNCGHVYISDADKQAYIRDKYLAMHSMTEIAKRNGVKCIRQQSFKNEEECVQKICKLFNAIMDEVYDYTDGKYPYKKGVKMLKASK